MTLRPGHGSGKGRLHVEVPPADELPLGVPAPAEEPERPDARGEGGRFAPGDGARAAGARGGRNNKGKTKLVRVPSIEGAEGTMAPGFEPFAVGARDFVRTHSARIARLVGGGELGPGPSSIIASAGQQLASSRYLYKKATETGDTALFVLSSRLANDSRQNLIAAHDVAAKEAAAHERANPVNAFEALRSKLWAETEPETEPEAETE